MRVPVQSPRLERQRLAQIGYYSFGICVVSFALEQLFNLSATAGFVPKWIPPGQMFWAIATTVAFGLAAIALLTGFMALLASRLTTAMIVGFGLLVWLPALFADPILLRTGPKVRRLSRSPRRRGLSRISSATVAQQSLHPRLWVMTFAPWDIRAQCRPRERELNPPQSSSCIAAFDRVPDEIGRT